MWKKLVRNGLRRCRQGLGLFGAGDLRPVFDLTPLGEQRFRADGPDPQFLLPFELPAGYYLVQTRLSFHQGRAQARLYPDFGDGHREADSLGWPVRSGKLMRRFIYLERPARLRFDPLAFPGEFQLGFFRVQRVPESVVWKYVRRHLAQAHPAHEPALSPASQVPAAGLWQDYCALFEPQAPDFFSYADWIAAVEQARLPSPDEQAAQATGWASQPRFSVLVPTYNTPPALLRECLDSVRAQTWPHWELCIADDASTEPAVRQILAEYAAADSRIRVLRRELNGHIARASNSALSLATGDFIALLDHDDRLAPEALWRVAQALQQHPRALVLYSDEDKLDATGQRSEPFFKPDWSPDLLRSQNYLSHLGVYRRSLVQALGGFRAGFEGSQDYDLALRCTEQASGPGQIVHIPHVLYHWRKTEGSTAADHGHKDYATPAALRALQAHFDRTQPGVQASVIAPGLYRARWPLPARRPLVSVIIPTRDACDILRSCVQSVLHLTQYPHLELIIVDNQSREPETLAYLDELSRHPAVRVLRHDQPFNYSAINNEAARQARGELLCLLNNDVTVISPDWLGEMVRQACRPDIGCVGAKLYYPDDTVQHAGVVLGIGGVAGHSHKYADREAAGYFSRLRIVHEVSAVTGAALVLRKAVFDEVGGLDEQGLSVAFNDVDLCLKVREAGYRNLWTPFAELYHHESKSRGSDLTPEKAARFESECRLMMARWAGALTSDPHYSPHLSLVREDFSLRAPAEYAALEAARQAVTDAAPAARPQVELNLQDEQVSAF